MRGSEPIIKGRRGTAQVFEEFDASVDRPPLKKIDTDHRHAMATDSVLVVDDNLENLTLTRALLQREGYGVRTAIDAEDALELLRTFRPRLILMDIQLPGINGLELTRRLKANTQTREMIIVAFTGCAGQEAEQNALEAGCDGFIAKPIGARALISLVVKYLHQGVKTSERS
jgi:two-component system cell cycle response regulator DivK